MIYLKTQKCKSQMTVQECRNVAKTMNKEFMEPPGSMPDWPQGCILNTSNTNPSDFIFYNTSICCSVHINLLDIDYAKLYHTI